jgi:hypothetical protein
MYTETQCFKAVLSEHLILVQSIDILVLLGPFSQQICLLMGDLQRTVKVEIMPGHIHTLRWTRTHVVGLKAIIVINTSALRFCRYQSLSIISGTDASICTAVVVARCNSG